MLTGYLLLWHRPGGNCQCVTLGRSFYNLLLKQEAVAEAQLLSYFVACRVP